MLDTKYLNDVREAKRILRSYTSDKPNWQSVEKWIRTLTMEERYKFINSIVVDKSETELNKVICEYPSDECTTQQAHAYMKNRYQSQPNFESVQIYFATLSRRILTIKENAEEDIFMQSKVRGHLYDYLSKTGKMRFNILCNLFKCGLIPSYMYSDVVDTIESVYNICSTSYAYGITKDFGAMRDSAAEVFDSKQFPYLRFNERFAMPETLKDLMKYKRPYTVIYNSDVQDKCLEECIKEISKDEVDKEIIRDVVRNCESNVRDYKRLGINIKPSRLRDILNGIAEIEDRILNETIGA